MVLIKVRAYEHIHVLDAQRLEVGPGIPPRPLEVGRMTAVNQHVPIADRTGHRQQRALSVVYIEDLEQSILDVYSQGFSPASFSLEQPKSVEGLFAYSP